MIAEVTFVDRSRLRDVCFETEVPPANQFMLESSHGRLQAEKLAKSTIHLGLHLDPASFDLISGSSTFTCGTSGLHLQPVAGHVAEDAPSSVSVRGAVEAVMARCDQQFGQNAPIDSFAFLPSFVFTSPAHRIGDHLIRLPVIAIGSCIILVNIFIPAWRLLHRCYITLPDSRGPEPNAFICQGSQIWCSTVALVQSSQVNERQNGRKRYGQWPKWRWPSNKPRIRRAFTRVDDARAEPGKRPAQWPKWRWTSNEPRIRRAFTGVDDARAEPGKQHGQRPKWRWPSNKPRIRRTFTGVDDARAEPGKRHGTGCLAHVRCIG